MEIAGIDSIDWSAPWLVPFAGLGEAIGPSNDWRGELNSAARERGIVNSRGQPITFAAGDAAADEPYEVFIARTGCVPTRANLHDFFNALVFLQFPGSKAQLNRLQSTAIARDGVRAGRGPVRDAATLIDENAVLLVTLRYDLVQSLRAHDWPTLFARQRGAWGDEVTVLAFGHALLEKLVRPYKAITAHALHVPLAAGASLAQVDQRLAAALDDDLSPQHLMPLPVLGIPAWCAQNNDASFYSDAAVFRPANMRPQKHSGESIE